MENFIYSVNATLPIFLVIVIGYVLKQIGMLNDEFVTVANKFNFKVTLPFLVFRDISSANIKEDFDIVFVLFCAIATTICFFVIWAGAKLFIKDKTITGAFVQASFRSSAAVMGIAFIQNIYGTSGMAPLMIIGSVPLYNIYSVIVLTLEAENSGQGKEKIKKALIGIVTNPIIIGIVLGLLVSLLGITFPTVVNKTVQNMASMASPLALIAIGAGFEGRKALAKIKPTIAVAVIKLVVQAGIFIPIAIHLGFRDEKMIAILVMLAAPTTPSCYIMAKNMNNDGVLTASAVVVTTLFSAVTLTFWIYLLKTVGMI
ncbi:MAG: AEC family transporter [Lachnospiraceae bacterium]|nr:AEC family transporter [Lachnospiraceae bacterium]